MKKDEVHPLRIMREQYNFTLEQLSIATKLSVKTLWKAEHGEPIGAESRRLLCKYFRKTSQELGLIATTKEKMEQKNKLSESLENKKVLSKSSIPDTSNNYNSFEGDSEGIIGRLDSAESILNLAWEAWFTSKPKQAAWEINKLLPKLDRMLHLSMFANHRLRIQELAIRCHGLLGAISLDALKNDTALYHYIHAFHIAEDMHDLSQSTTYLALMGDTLRRQGEKKKAISYMENALTQASVTSNAVQGHILQLLAYTYADTGNEADFERTIAHATDMLAFSGEATDIARKEFVPFEIYEIRGKANRDLGKPLQSLQYLDLAAQTLRRDAVPLRWYAMLDISKGQAYCDAGDLSTGVTLARQGFLQAYQYRSLRQMNRVRKLLRRLEANGLSQDGNVMELKDVLHETYMHMDPEG